MGYATVAPGHVEIDPLPVTRRRKLPRFVLGLSVRLADDLGLIPLEVLRGMSGERPTPLAVFLPVGDIEDT